MKHAAYLSENVDPDKLGPELAKTMTRDELLRIKYLQENDIELITEADKQIAKKFFTDIRNSQKSIPVCTAWLVQPFPYLNLIAPADIQFYLILY